MVVSVYFGADVIDDLRRFDDQFRDRGAETYKRSAEIKRAMATHRVVDNTLAKYDAADLEERDRRALVRQAIHDHFREGSPD